MAAKLEKMSSVTIEAEIFYHEGFLILVTRRMIAWLVKDT